MARKVDAYTTVAVLILFMAVVLIVYLLVNRGAGGTIKAEGPGGFKVSVEGKSTPVLAPGRVAGEDLAAGRDLTAENKEGGDVEVMRASAQRDIRLSTRSGEETAIPK